MGGRQGRVALGARAGLQSYNLVLKFLYALSRLRGYGRRPFLGLQPYRRSPGALGFEFRFQRGDLRRITPLHLGGPFFKGVFVGGGQFGLAGGESGGRGLHLGHARAEKFVLLRQLTHDLIRGPFLH